MVVDTALKFATVAMNVFSEERQRYYDNKIKKLQAKILEVEDSDFAHKDMNAKGMAERAIMMEKGLMADEMMNEIAAIKAKKV